MRIPGIESQRDPRWATIELGFNTDPYYNLYHFGCAIDAAANILWWVTGDASWTPERVNNWLKSNSGYTDGAQVNRGGLIVWGALAVLMGKCNIAYRGFSSDLNAVNGFLQADPNFAIAQLTGPGFPMHFSAMPFVGQIADSWDARLKPVGAYHFVGAHMFTHLVPEAAAAPPSPVAEPDAHVQAPTPAPLPQATPETVPSHTEPVEDPNPAPAVEPAQAVPVTVATTSPGAVEVVPPPVSTTATPPENLLQDEPAQPEWERTWKPFAQIEYVELKRDTQAIDAQGLGHPVALVASKPFATAGTFADNGELFYRGTSEHWYGVPASDVIGGEQSQPVQLGFWRQLFSDPLGALIRLFSKTKA